MSVELARYPLGRRGVFDESPPALSWDYLNPWHGGPRDLAMVTCARGHTTRLTAAVHSVDHDGNVLPSYVCTIEGCDFHETIKLVGWDNDERRSQ